MESRRISPQLAERCFRPVSSMTLPSKQTARLHLKNRWFGGKFRPVFFRYVCCLFVSGSGEVVVGKKNKNKPRKFLPYTVPLPKPPWCSANSSRSTSHDRKATQKKRGNGTPKVSGVVKFIWVFPKKRDGPPKSSIKKYGFPLFSPSILGVSLFLETPIYVVL